MKAILLLCSVFTCVLISQLTFAENTISVDYGSRLTKSEKKIKKDLIESGVINQVTSFINSQLSLRYPLRIVFGNDDGPLYDDETKDIIIPYGFIDEVNERFQYANYTKRGISTRDATFDALIHTLFHEFGHAIIPMFDIPVLGKEENTVDNLATVILLEYFDDGANIAISAADLFDLESEDIETYTDDDFKGEHGLESQRYYNTLCMIYGSQPNKNRHIKKKAGFSQERADLCEEDYERISRSWLSILEKYRKNT